MKLPTDISWRVIMFLNPTNIDHSAQFADLSKGFGAAAIQYITAAKQQDTGKIPAVSNILAGVGTGATITAVSLAMLRIIGG